MNICFIDNMSKIRAMSVRISAFFAINGITMPNFRCVVNKAGSSSFTG